MIDHLTKLANDLDLMGYEKEADQVDLLIKEAIGLGDIAGWFRDKYNKLKEKFRRKEETKQAPPAASPQEAEQSRQEAEQARQEYEEEKKEAFEEVLQRKEAGPPEGRLYLWYTHPYDSGCPICAARNGEMRTLGYWRANGFPGRGNHTCEKRPNCNCLLIRMKPGGAPDVTALNNDGKFDISDVIGLGEDNTKKNMQSGPMFTGEQFFNNFGQST